MLRAVGFTRRRATLGLILEHGGLVIWGLLCGVAAAAVGIMPVVRSGEATLPWALLGGVGAVSLGAGVLSVVVAAWWATRAPIAISLRRER